MMTIVTGKNTFEADDYVRQLIAAYKQDGGDLAVERYDASEVTYDAVLQAVQALPFLAPKKLVIVHDAAANKELFEKIETLADRVADGVQAVLVAPKIDKRAAYYKELKKHAEIKECKELAPHELPKWVVSYAESGEARCSMSDARLLVDRVGTNQALLAREVEKLAQYDPQISRASIELLTEVSAQSTVFQLLDAVFSGNRAQAMKLYREQRAARVDPHYIIAMLTWQLTALGQAAFAVPQTEQTLTRAGVSPYTAKKSLALAKKTSPASVKRYIAELTELDAQIKTNADPDAGLEAYLLSL